MGNAALEGSPNPKPDPADIIVFHAPTTRKLEMTTVVPLLSTKQESSGTLISTPVQDTPPPATKASAGLGVIKKRTLKSGQPGYAEDLKRRNRESASKSNERKRMRLLEAE